MKPNEKLYTEQVQAGGRTYFFDVGKAENESLYIQISEAKEPRSPTPERRIIVFEEHLREFNNALRRARRFLLKKYGMSLSDLDEGRQQLPRREERGTTGPFGEIRKDHPRAYEKWTDQEDARLRSEFQREKSIRVLAARFRRQPGAITSRLRKLKLID